VAPPGKQSQERGNPAGQRGKCEKQPCNSQGTAGGGEEEEQLWVGPWGSHSEAGGRGTGNEGGKLSLGNGKSAGGDVLGSAFVFLPPNVTLIGKKLIFPKSRLFCPLQSSVSDHPTLTYKVFHHLFSPSVLLRSRARAQLGGSQQPAKVNPPHVSRTTTSHNREVTDLPTEIPCTPLLV